MTALIAITGALQQPSSVLLDSTNATDVFAPTEGLHTVWSIAIANNDTSNACRIAIRWHDGTTAYDLYQGSVEAGETEGVTHGLPMPINPGATNGQGVAKKITAQAGSANDLTITVSSSRVMPQQTR